MGGWENGFMNTFTTIGERLYFLLTLEALWVIGLIGYAVVFGIFPATYITFAVARNYLQRFDVKINRVFWKVYQTRFLKSQLEVWAWI